MENFQQTIGYTFKDKELLLTAITHKSFTNDNPGNDYYERLEFLGDSILGFTAADMIYNAPGKLKEGKMTSIRAGVVCEDALSKVALNLGINRVMRLGHGEETSGGRSRVSVLADMVESVIAAIYLDGGLEEAQKFIRRFVMPDSAEIAENAIRDYKSLLQEEVQKQPGQTIEYAIVWEKGPPHDKTFSIQVLIDGIVYGSGIGKTKKSAEQSAACQALKKL